MKALILFTRQLAAMLRGGLSLVTSFHELEEIFPHKGFAKAAGRIGMGLKDGYSLAELLKTQRSLFPMFYTKLVEAGEKGDSLQQALETLAEYYSEGDVIKNRLRSVLSYPILLVGVALVSGLFSLWHVVPTFSSLYATLGTEVPPATQWVFQTARFLTPARLAWAATMGIAALLAGAAYVSRKMRWPRLAKLPLAGNLSCYWFCRITRMLVGAGLTLEHALLMTAEVSARGPAPMALAEIRKGNSLYAALEGSPGVMRSFVAQGELTGELPIALERAAGYYRVQLEESMENFQRLLEPLAVLFTGGLVAGMLLVLMLPMLQLARVF